MHTFFCVFYFDGSVPDFELFSVSSSREDAERFKAEITTTFPKAQSVTIAEMTLKGLVETLLKRRLQELHDVLIRLEQQP